MASGSSAEWDPDVRLMLEVRDDKAGAFQGLMLRYQERLVRVLEHLVGHRDQAEDLAQEVFLRVYRSRKNYVPEGRFSTWLFTIANDVAVNTLRQGNEPRQPANVRLVLLARRKPPAFAVGTGS